MQHYIYMSILHCKRAIVGLLVWPPIPRFDMEKLGKNKKLKNDHYRQLAKELAAEPGLGQVKLILAPWTCAAEEFGMA